VVDDRAIGDHIGRSIGGPTSWALPQTVEQCLASSPTSSGPTTSEPSPSGAALEGAKWPIARKEPRRAVWILDRPLPAIKNHGFILREEPIAAQPLPRDPFCEGQTGSVQGGARVVEGQSSLLVQLFAFGVNRLSGRNCE
jgi:hypothetical protein